MEIEISLALQIFVKLGGSQGLECFPFALQYFAVNMVILVSPLSLAFLHPL